MAIYKLLDYQADQIEMVLHAHQMQGRVTGGIVTPRWVRFDVVFPLGQKPDALDGLREALAHRLGAEVRVHHEAGRVVVEMARADRHDITLTQVSHQVGRMAAMAAILGLDLADGAALLLHLPSSTVTHVLLAGMTGSGKTELMRTMLASLARYNEPGRLQMYVIDPLARSYNDLAWLPHLPLGGVTSDLGDTEDVLGMLVAEMERRSQSGDVEPRIVVAIDELADLVATCPDILRSLTRLTQRGRGAGIHVIAGTQKPTAGAIGSLVKANFPVHLVGQVNSPEEAKIASGLARTGAELLQGRGDFILCKAGKPLRFQAAKLDGEFLYHLRRDIRRSGYAGPQGDPLADYRKHVKSQLQVLPGGRDDEEQARRIIGLPGWVEKWWDPVRCELGYGVGSEIGNRLVPKEDNAGGGHLRIKRVEEVIVKVLSNVSVDGKKLP